MKRFFLILILFFQVLNLSAGNLSNPLEQAKKLAIGANKLILVDFYADWCGPCKRMDSESWYNDEIKEIATNFIFVKIDIDIHKNIAKKYGVTGIPYIFILDPNGEVVYKNIGYLDKQALKRMLNKYAVNLKYLQTSYIINFKKETISSDIRLAQKQQEFSILLDKNLKRDFISLSRNYLSKAKKLLKKDKNSAYTQKIELLYLHSYLISGNYSKVNKKLKKEFKKENIEDTNKSLFCFLNYMICIKDQNTDLAQQWLSEMKEHTGNKVFLKEIELLHPKI